MRLNCDEHPQGEHSTKFSWPFKGKQKFGLLPGPWPMLAALLRGASRFGLGKAKAYDAKALGQTPS